MGARMGSIQNQADGNGLIICDLNDPNVRSSGPNQDAPGRTRYLCRVSMALAFHIFHRFQVWFPRSSAHWSVTEHTGMHGDSKQKDGETRWGCEHGHPLVKWKFPRDAETSELLRVKTHEKLQKLHVFCSVCEAWWPVSCAYSCSLATCVLSGVRLFADQNRALFLPIFLGQVYATVVFTLMKMYSMTVIGNYKALRLFNIRAMLQRLEMLN